MSTNIAVRALDDERIRLLAPSVFATEPSDKVSDRYGFLPTSQVLAGLRANGFLPFSARQSVAISAGIDHVRHELRFRHVDTLARLEALVQKQRGWLAEPEEFDEIVLVNSHDGTTSFSLSHGVHRVLCGNGLIVSGAEKSERIKHSGNIVDNVIEGATRILSDAQAAVESRDEMRMIALDEEERVEFASAALQLCFPQGSCVTPPAVLVPRRPQDAAPNLWTTFNVVQENIIKGGVLGRTAEGRAVRTRGITSITRDHAVNRMLWTLAASARSVTTLLENVNAARLEAVEA